MRRKTIIVLGITFMVTVMVAVFSYIYLSQILRQRITNAYENATLLTQQLAYVAENDVPDFSSTRLDTNDPVAVRRALMEYLPTDVNLNNMLQSDVGNWPFIYDAAIVGMDGKALLHTNASMVGKTLNQRPDFQQVVRAHFREQLRLVYSPAVYNVSFPLLLNGQPFRGETFGTIRIGVSTSFLKSELTPRLIHALYISIASIFVSLVLAAAISNLAFGPLEQISRNLDSVTAGDAAALAAGESGHDEYGLVTLKIANLGRQMRDTKEIFSALKDNVDQLMANLQDGLMLFARDSRVVLVSAPVERFLGRPRAELLGHSANEVFTRGTMLGAVVLDAFERKRPLLQRELDAASGRRVQVSLDFVQEKNSQIGALLIMRDAESVQRIGDEIEMSRRLSASGRSHSRCGARGEEPHQRHRAAPAAPAEQAGEIRAGHASPHGYYRQRNPAPGPRSADSGGLYPSARPAPGGSRSAARAGRGCRPGRTRRRATRGHHRARHARGAPSDQGRR